MWRNYDVISLLNNYIVEYSFRFPLVHTVCKIHQEMREL